MKHVFLWMTVALAAWSLAMVATAPGRVEDGRTTLVVASSTNQTFRDYMEMVERRNPDLRFVNDAGNTEMTKVVVQSTAGVGPDLFMSMNSFHSQAFVRAGIAWDITDELLARGIDLDQMAWPATRTMYKVDGRVYGIPRNVAADGIWFNKDAFDEAGLDYPGPTLTRDEFLEVARRLTIRDESGRVVRYGFMFGWTAWGEFLRQWGARVYSDGGTRCVIDSPEAVAAVQFMLDLERKWHVAPTVEEEAAMATAGGWGSGTITIFGGGRAAMALGGRWWLVVLRDERNYPGLQLGVTEPLLGPVRAHAGYAGVMMINRHSPHREEALRALTLLTDPDYNAMVNRQADAMAAMKSAAYTDEFEFNPQFPQETYNVVWRQIMERALPAEISPFVNGAVAERTINTQLALIRAGRKSPKQGMRDAAVILNREILQTIERDPELRAQYERLVAAGAPAAGRIQ